jgi:hypothetical protein
MVIGCAWELDQPSLLVLEHVLRALWVTSNPRHQSHRNNRELAMVIRNTGSAAALAAASPSFNQYRGGTHEKG